MKNAKLAFLFLIIAWALTLSFIFFPQIYFGASAWVVVGLTVLCIACCAFAGIILVNHILGEK